MFIAHLLSRTARIESDPVDILSSLWLMIVRWPVHAHRDADDHVFVWLLVIGIDGNILMVNNYYETFSCGKRLGPASELVVGRTAASA